MVYTQNWVQVISNLYGRHFLFLHNICSISSPFLSFNLLRVFKREERREKREQRESKGRAKGEQRKRKKNEQIFQKKAYKLMGGASWRLLNNF